MNARDVVTAIFFYLGIALVIFACFAAWYPLGIMASAGGAFVICLIAQHRGRKP